MKGDGHMGIKLSVIRAVAADNRGVILALDSGAYITLRIGLTAFLEHCRACNSNPIGCRLSIIDDSWMGEHWTEVVRIYRRIGAALPQYAEVYPRSFLEFRTLPFDLLGNGKEKLLYPTREWQVSPTLLRTWVFDAGARLIISHREWKPVIQGRMTDIVRTVSPTGASPAGGEVQAPP